MRLYKLIFLLALLIITGIIINKYTAFYAIVYFVVRHTFSNSIVINNILKARTLLASLGRVKNYLEIKGTYSGNNPRKSTFTADFCRLIIIGSNLMLARFYPPFPLLLPVVKSTRWIIKQRPWSDSSREKTIFAKFHRNFRAKPLSTHALFA